MEPLPSSPRDVHIKALYKRIDRQTTQLKRQEDEIRELKEENTSLLDVFRVI